MSVVERFKPHYGIFADSRWLTLLANREEIQLSTSCDCPPIPDRSMDWSAIDSNTYDCDFIGGEDDEWKESGGHGHGATEQEAIDDLFDQLEERADG